MGLFVRKILDDRPENILEYAGTFFDRAELRDVVEAAIDQEKREAARNEHLNNLIKGKTLIQWESKERSFALFRLIVIEYYKFINN